MLPIDVVMDMPVQDVEMVQVANAFQAKKPRIATLCGISSSKTGEQFSTIPYMDIIELLPKSDRPKTLSQDDWHSVVERTGIVHQPKHGLLENSIEVIYRPDEGFEGEDRFTLRTVYEGQQFTLHYRVYVSFTKALGPTHDCSKPPFANSKISVLPKEIDPANWYRATSLQTFLTNAQAALTGFTDLSGASLGQTAGDQITLDTDAAGHGWYIDYTPYLNEEWL
jgi:hypothetical protein